MDKPYISKITSYGSITVWRVDGSWVRNHLDIDFTEGGHGYVYSYVPKNEVWIDNVNEPEHEYIMLHELYERSRMLRGMGYEAAHDQANIMERQARADPTLLPQLLDMAVEANDVDLKSAVLKAADYYERHYGALPGDIAMKVSALKFHAGMSLEEIENEYATVLYECMDDYANHDRPVTSYRNRYNRAVNDAFNGAVVAGWIDGGADGPIPSALQAWVNERISAESDFVGGMFADLKELRKKGDENELANFIQDRAQGYTATLEGVYLQGKTYAMGERPGKWQLGATEKHCGTCSSLHGTTHPINWYREQGYIPRQQGSPTLDCGGWKCDCSVIDPETGEQLL